MPNSHILQLYKTKPKMLRVEIAEQLRIPFKEVCYILCQQAQENAKNKKANYVCICEKEG